MIKLVINKWTEYHVSLDTVAEFEKTILSSSSNMGIIVKKNSKLLSSLSYKFYLVLKKLRLLWILKLTKSFRGKNNLAYFTILMGDNFQLCLPYFFGTGSKNIYLFDAWFKTHKKIVDFVNDLKVSNVFISSSGATENLRKYKSECKFHWIPEGINLTEYFFNSYEEKYIDVLQLGRRYDPFHNKIVKPLLEKQKLYLYEKQKGEIIFPTREMFINGLASSKISICFPSSVTHSNRAEGLETMTMRFLQSIASKCLIVGKAPIEMINLFGYNPVIEADLSNPLEQLEDILLNYKEYFLLIEKNYRNIFNHQWLNRWINIKEIINL